MNIMKNPYSKTTGLEPEITFVTVEKLPPQRTKMPSVLWPTIRAMQKVLISEVGFFKGSSIFLKAITWGNLFNKPQWHPEYFEFKNREEEDHFKGVFKELTPIIIVFFTLKKEYGESFASDVTGKMGIPISVPYQLEIFKPGIRIKKIDDIRQLISDLLGDGKGHEWTEAVSEDQQQVRYHFTKCVFIVILRAYGLTTFAGNVCLADHVVFDNMVPDIVFSRKHILGGWDRFCDHTIKLRKPGDTENDESNYEDCHKVRFGRESVKEWEEYFTKNGKTFTA